jgi:CMP-N-acetylneuraminic acid synthetase
MQVKIVIPAKGQSVRVPQKNLRPFYGNTSLLQICLEKVKTLGVPVAVNSEDDEILELAERMGVEAQRRPIELATPETTPQELSRHIAEANADADYIMYVHCTNPLISVEHFKTALAIPPEKWKGFDSMNSAYLVQKHVWHDRTPLYDIVSRPGTQGIKNIRALEYSINVISREKLLEYSDFIGKNPAFLMIPYDEVIDIDEVIDFEVAQMLYEKRHKN